MLRKVKTITAMLFFLCALSSCTYNPFSAQNRLTGNVIGPVAGGVIGAGGLAAMGAPRSLIVLGGLGGSALGYYVTTLRYDAGGVTAVGGQVFQIGDFMSIDIPTDYLFEENSARFLSYAPPILDSAVDILQRYGDRSIKVAGNTSGFDRPERETYLSKARAKAVVAYLREAGINAFKESSIDFRSINYVGYGDRHPVAHPYTNNSIRQNSHIQISVYPSKRQLAARPYRYVFKDIGAIDDSGYRGRRDNKCIGQDYGMNC